MALTTSHKTLRSAYFQILYCKGQDNAGIFMNEVSIASQEMAGHA
jgi:hypothetical protein